LMSDTGYATNATSVIFVMVVKGEFSSWLAAQVNGAAPAIRNRRIPDRRFANMLTVRAESHGLVK
jgi:hypothetical protein